MKKISYIIRTLNEEKFIGKLLEKINSQKNPQNFEIEVVVVDNDSTDDTLNIVSKYNTKLIHVPRAEFNWGSALNLGIANSTGDLIIIMSAHAIPFDDSWLDKMISPFTDKQIAGVYCRQLAWPDAPWYEIYRLNNTFKTQYIKFNSNTSNEEMHFSNAASCIKRSLWEKYNFKILPAAEDIDWANWSINNGYSIYYAADAKVYHSHKETPRYRANKTIEIVINQDVIHNRKRYCIYTIMQALRSLIDDSIKIIKLKTVRKNIFLSLCDSILYNFWFVLDFKMIQQKVDAITKQHKSH